MAPTFTDKSTCSPQWVPGPVGAAHEMCLYCCAVHGVVAVRQGPPFVGTLAEPSAPEPPRPSCVLRQDATPIEHFFDRERVQRLLRNGAQKNQVHAEMIPETCLRLHGLEGSPYFVFALGEMDVTIGETYAVSGIRVIVHGINSDDTSKLQELTQMVLDEIPTQSREDVIPGIIRRTVQDGTWSVFARNIMDESCIGDSELFSSVPGVTKWKAVHKETNSDGFKRGTIFTGTIPLCLVMFCPE